MNADESFIRKYTHICANFKYEEVGTHQAIN